MNENEQKPAEPTEERRCLNCGTMCTDRYCPHCGQSTSVRRLNKATFTNLTTSSILRVNRIFFSTCRDVVLRPWKVISEYLQGKRVRYTSPVMLLMLLAFYCLLFTHWLMPGKADPQISIDSESPFIATFVATFNFLISNPGITALVLMVPVLVSVRLVFRRAGSGRFNSVEYMVAGCYMLSAYYAVSLIVLPFDAIFRSVDLDWVKWLYWGIVSLMAARRAFPSSKKKLAKRMALLGLYASVLSLLYVMLMVTIVFLIAIVVYVIQSI